ncbi:RidA family protein [Sulfitobacter sp. JB4-11]|uniref:RidA family protein n=1 Tax=Sulfitobacter rhodophyticola TaxID=3238304 RepID=UPI00351486CC
MTGTIIQPEGWAKPKGYANGILDKNGILHVAGQVGWDENEVFQTHDFIGQMAQALKNIRAIVLAAGGQVSDVVRLTWYVTDAEDYLMYQAEVGTVYRKVFGHHFPAMSLVVVRGLIEPGALLEIEATAVLDID